MWLGLRNGVRWLVWLPAMTAAGGWLTAAEVEPREVAPHVWHIARIADRRLKECSGMVRCSTDTNVFWVHNDGWRPILYGIDRAGEKLAEVPILGTMLLDWEDLATDFKGHLYVGDVGNNDATRRLISVYRVKEPNPKEGGRPVEVERAWHLRYPEKPFDTEALFIWGGHGYVVPKVFNDARASIYGFALGDTNEVITLDFVSDLDVTTPVTGAAISPDGNRLALVGSSGGFVFRIRGDIAAAGRAKEYRARFKEHQIEGCCFVEDGLLAVSETRDLFLFTDRGFRTR